MLNKPVLFDVDGVVADFIGACLDFINNRDGTNLAHKDVPGDIRKYSFWTDDCEDHIRSAGFCLNLKPIEKWSQCVNEVKAMDVPVMFVTSPYDAPLWAYERIKWLEKHFDATRDDVILARMKKYVSGIVLVDDLPRNVYEWCKYNEREQFGDFDGVLVDQPWNQETPYPDHSFNRASPQQVIDLVHGHILHEKLDCF